MKENGLFMCFAVSLIALLGSLYFSEIEEYIPCTFCWYQRILMYPLVVLLGMAAVRKDLKQSIYIMPLAGLGVCISAFHYLTQKMEFFSRTAAACGIVPCNIQYIDWLGFITIPLLAFAAFLFIFIIQFLLWRI